MFHPYGNPSSNETLLWGAEPRFRGTYSILSSCIITIGLCVWTAVHLNVPEHGKVMPQFLRKVKWLAVGLFAPELVAWTAFQQRREAQMICDVLRDCFAQPPLPSTLRTVWCKLRTALNWSMVWKQDSIQETTYAEMLHAEEGRPCEHYPFTLIHGHYIAMGGLAVDTAGARDVFISNFANRRSLTSSGLGLLLDLNPELLPSLSEEEIYDKSKASGLAKALVCLQAAWFRTQIVVRIASHLTISILELNTFAHALCTLLVFCLWWEKPLDVTEPTLIQGEVAHPIIALLHVLDDKGYETEGYCNDYFGRNPCPKCPHRVNVLCHDMAREIHPEIVRSADDQLKMDRHYEREKEKYETKVPLLQGFVRAVELEPFHGFAATFLHRRFPHHRSVFHAFIDLPLSFIKCLELARSAARRGVPMYRDKYLQKRMENMFWPFLGQGETGNFLRQAITGITIAGLLYGGLHLTAWNAPMPHTAKLLWRTGGVLIALSGPACLPVVFHHLWQSHRVRRFVDTWCMKLLRYSVICHILLVTIAYVAARIFLVVECFINVLHLPASTFEVPQWSQYFPHIS
ncbi:hypothetical protein HBI82_185340 [Parastagonospora nodorum]|nr:hypothetical protein HBI74_131620 [Parastagonospora nodorum]KAH5425545.1 hypothetical protein HBI46_053530 [Parastagonospora nodorum]KAH5456272.1 hypothetical protein HBI30_083600 [Parastagonospora nodorum]KAH5992621.1 hypothetical protein HBI82_185340 [Parastagonospora nodorum]KAH6106009.1 hypothetical protein HBI65_032920 [Parastagonospora nodorum]